MYDEKNPDACRPSKTAVYSNCHSKKTGERPSLDPEDMVFFAEKSDKLIAWKVVRKELSSRAPNI
jgi:hypothetical protein